MTYPRNPDSHLFRAIEKRDHHEVQAAIDRGAHLMARRKYKTPLLAAVFLNDATTVKILMDAGAQATEAPMSRDPVSAAMWRGNNTLIATLLKSENTPDAIAIALASKMQSHPKASFTWEIGRSLLNSRWQDVFSSMSRQNLLACQSGEAWWRQLPLSNSNTHTISLLHRTFPLLNHISQHDILGTLIKGHPTLDYLKFLGDEGQLSSQVLFETAIDQGGNFFIELTTRHYCAIPTIKWLLRHAGKQEHGCEYLRKLQPVLLPHFLGARASWPLARLLCKITQSDLTQSFLYSSDSVGRTALHLLFEIQSEANRRRDIADTLMKEGADPMTLDLLGRPACYGTIFYGNKSEQMMRVASQYGADFSPSGLVSHALERETTKHERWKTKARDGMTRFYSKKTHEDLQATTPEITSCAATRRI